MKRLLYITLYLIIIQFTITNNIYSYNWYEKPKYFFATVNVSDSTIFIYFDGNFYFHEINAPQHYKINKNKYGTNLKNPTIYFIQKYFKQLIDEHSIKNINLQKIENSTFYKILTKNIPYPFISEEDIILVIDPSKDARGYVNRIKIESYLLSPGGPWSYPSLLGKSYKIDNIGQFKNRFLVASILNKNYKYINSQNMHSQEIPYLVQCVYDSMNSQLENKIEELINKTTSEQEKIFLKNCYEYETSIQPVLINTEKVRNEYMYLITSYYGEKNYISNTIYINHLGKNHSPPINYIDGKLTKCLGSVRFNGHFGAEDLIVYHKSIGDYNSGYSLFKYDNNGNFREILFLQVYYD